MKRAFTLIELLVVLAIIGIITALVVGVIKDRRVYSQAPVSQHR